MVLLAFFTFVAIGGVNFVAVRFSNRELPPFLGAGLRFGVAALLLSLAVLATRLRLPRGKSMVGSVVYGLLAFGVAYAFAYYALTELPAGAGAVVFASYPLFTVILAPLHRIERFRLRGLAGAVLAVVGIVILADLRSAEGLPIVPVLAMVGSAVSAAEAGVLLKRFPAVAPIAANTVAMGTGAALLLTLSVATGEAWVLPQLGTTWLAVVYLAVIGSAGLFGLFLFVLQRWTATSTSYATALLPVSAIAAGALIGGEAITPNAVVGGMLVLIAVYVGALSGPDIEPPPVQAPVQG